MSRVPKFILSDQVRLQASGLQKTMMIERFQTKRVNGVIEYTGIVECYWFEGSRLWRDIFDEDKLEKIN